MKTWFITGASRGFGLLIAKVALARGDNVVATARRPQAIVDALDNHPQLLALPLDVTDEHAAVDAVKLAAARFGRIDVLVNNAGYGLLGAVEESSAEEVRRLYETNVFGLLNVTRAVLPVMRQQRRGHVINISSLGGYQAYYGWGVYGSTKFAVEGITEALAQELQPLGIHATVVEPGFFRTDFLDTSSLSSTALLIGDYADTVGAMRVHAAAANHQQPGNPLQLAKALMVLADTSQPPVRLPLGSDAIARIRSKNATVERELNEWMALALSTDFATSEPHAA